MNKYISGKCEEIVNPFFPQVIMFQHELPSRLIACVPMNSLTKPAVAGNQATWVADASNLSDISGRRIPNDQVQPPMIAKLTMKQPTKKLILIASLCEKCITSIIYYSLHIPVPVSTLSTTFFDMHTK